MATVTLGPTYGWAVGETITVYARDSRNVQTGSAITTAAVAADSRVTFTGLADDLKLIATDGTYAVRFGTLTDPSTGEGGEPSGDAGGVLDGTYPNPTFAADMASQAELDAHLIDTTAVHGIGDTAAIKGVVVWTAGGIPTRPATFLSVEWIGPADPAVNAVNGDTWTPTA